MSTSALSSSQDATIPTSKTPLESAQKFLTGSRKPATAWEHAVATKSAMPRRRRLPILPPRVPPATVPTQPATHQSGHHRQPRHRSRARLPAAREAKPPLARLQLRLATRASHSSHLTPIAPSHPSSRTRRPSTRNPGSGSQTQPTTSGPKCSSPSTTPTASRATPCTKIGRGPPSKLSFRLPASVLATARSTTSMCLAATDSRMSRRAFCSLR